MADSTPGVATPETPVAAPETEATPVSNSTAEPIENPSGDEPNADQPEKTLTQSEVNKLLSKERAREARRVERALRAEVERDHLRQQLEVAQQQPNRDRASQEDPEPKEEAFAGKPYSEYARALARWEIRQELKADRERQAHEQQQRQQSERVQRDAQYVNEKLIAKGQDKYRDFDDVVLAEHVPISPAMVAVAAKLDNGADVLYELAQNESELRRIARLSDIEQAWEMRDFSRKLGAPSKPTSVPEPIKPTGSKASSSADPDKMPMEDWLKWRKASLRKK